MKTLNKITALIFFTAVVLEMIVLPVGAILLLAKICGAGMTWAGACIPFFIGFGLAPFISVSKFLIDMSGDKH